VEVCPSGALELVGTPMTEAQVLEEIKKDILFYDQSKGGVTFSGGEPLAQPEFLCNLLRACKEQEIHTTVDTCGYAPQEDLLKVVGYTDLFLYDIKVVSDQIHVRETGVSNRLILQNLRTLPPDKVIVRIPLIPGVNDSTKSIQELARLVSSYRINQVALLPYHRGGVEKAKRLFASESTVYEPPSPDTIQNALTILQEHGLNPQIGG
jgi:pyruvate formate lyase activating enzyme